MNFYGIVPEIKEGGFYGRKEGAKNLTKTDKKLMLSSTAVFAGVAAAGAGVFGAGIVAALIPPFIPFIALPWLIDVIKKNIQGSPIINLSTGEEKEEMTKMKMVIIPNKALARNYNINNEEAVFGLFKTQGQFKSIMKSQGNSNLVILERDNLPEYIKHSGGEKGIFSYGLYCEHPKDKNTLISLMDYNQQIKTMILEETLRVYEALGAKSIRVEDITNIDISNKIKASKVNLDGSAGKKNEILRDMKFGNGFYDPERAKKQLCFVPDYANLMTVVNSRINGNQLSQEFKETININVGLDIDVVGLFKNETKFIYDRKWHFKVEFYDKNKL